MTLTQEEAAIVEAVRVAIASKVFERTPRTMISYQGRDLFVVTPREIRCSRCHLPLVPQFKDGMAKWTRAKVAFVRAHADCPGP